jgi:hypothetical protein
MPAYGDLSGEKPCSLRNRAAVAIAEACRVLAVKRTRFGQAESDC